MMSGQVNKRNSIYKVQELRTQGPLAALHPCAEHTET